MEPLKFPAKEKKRDIIDKKGINYERDN